MCIRDSLGGEEGAGKDQGHLGLGRRLGRLGQQGGVGLVVGGVAGGKLQLAAGGGQGGQLVKGDVGAAGVDGGAAGAVELGLFGQVAQHRHLFHPWAQGEDPVVFQQHGALGGRLAGQLLSLIHI